MMCESVIQRIVVAYVQQKKSAIYVETLAELIKFTLRGHVETAIGQDKLLQLGVFIQTFEKSADKFCVEKDVANFYPHQTLILLQFGAQIEDQELDFVF